MASNWAIVIGINQYRFLQPLKYAKRDAEAISAFLAQEAKFDRIFLFTDDSPAIGGKPTEPFRANLLRVLRQIFATPFMKDGDNFWFFFSGHGIPHNGQDYLMPLDGDPEDIENTGISTNMITNYLRSCGADNAVMILDACRSGGKKAGEGIGRQTESEARQTGVISLFSCSPDQYSYELEAIKQGAFTHALLEGLGIRGRCATVERLNQYLEHRVPELVSQHLGRVRQTPYTIAEPLNRAHLILMPQYASLNDIATLKNDAYRAQVNQNWDLAQQLWIRVLAAASGREMEAIEALQRIAVARASGTVPIQPQPTNPPDQPKSSVSSPSPPPVSPIPNDDIPLESEKGIDYRKLRGLLKAGKWREADYETYLRMLRVIGREESDWIRDDEILNFPYKDLKTIDRLWVYYSNGKFGFSIQKKLYVECGAELDGTYPGDEIWYKFCDRVGWRRNNRYVEYDDLKFDLSNSSVGELPGFIDLGAWDQGLWWVLFSNKDISYSSDLKRNSIGAGLAENPSGSAQKLRENPPLPKIIVPPPPTPLPVIVPLTLPQDPVGASLADDPSASSPRPRQNRPLQQTPTTSPLTRRKVLWFLGLSSAGIATSIILNVNHTENQQPQAPILDYSTLEELLQAQQWREADQETRNLMLSIAGRTEEGWLDSASIQNFPCEVLVAIDELWVNHSNGRFGFSVQRKIWEEVGSPTEYNAQWEEFGDRVGWRNDGSWLNYSELQFNAEISPSGELPAGGWGWGAGVVWVHHFFFSYAKTCEL